jgi:hypothetical protein
VRSLARSCVMRHWQSQSWQSGRPQQQKRQQCSRSCSAYLRQAFRQTLLQHRMQGMLLAGTPLRRRAWQPCSSSSSRILQGDPAAAHLPLLLSRNTLLGSSSRWPQL